MLLFKFARPALALNHTKGVTPVSFEELDVETRQIDLRLFDFGHFDRACFISGAHKLEPVPSGGAPPSTRR